MVQNPPRAKWWKRISRGQDGLKGQDAARRPIATMELNTRRENGWCSRTMIACRMRDFLPVIRKRPGIITHQSLKVKRLRLVFAHGWTWNAPPTKPVAISGPATWLSAKICFLNSMVLIQIFREQPWKTLISARGC